jgi:hypothetical protein
MLDRWSIGLMVFSVFQLRKFGCKAYWFLFHHSNPGERKNMDGGDLTLLCLAQRLSLLQAIGNLAARFELTHLS